MDTGPSKDIQIQVSTKHLQINMSLCVTPTQNICRMPNCYSVGTTIQNQPFIKTFQPVSWDMLMSGIMHLGAGQKEAMKLSF